MKKTLGQILKELNLSFFYFNDFFLLLYLELDHQQTLSQLLPAKKNIYVYY